MLVNEIFKKKSNNAKINKKSEFNVYSPKPSR